MNLLNKKISIIGLGYVGLPLAVAFAKKFQVVGGDGIQTILGKKFRDVKQKTIGHAGYPICAGIGFWIVFKWMK